MEAIAARVRVVEVLVHEEASRGSLWSWARNTVWFHVSEERRRHAFVQMHRVLLPGLDRNPEAL